MEEIRNIMDKLVCRIEKNLMLVEIVHKGCKTQIRFFVDGRVEVSNSILKNAA